MAAYQTVTLTGTYQTPDGTPHKGHVEIIPSERVIKDTTGDVILTGRVKVDLDAQGAFTVALPATDDPTLNPTGFGYTIAAKLHSSHPPAVSFSLPASLGATTVEDLTPVDPSTFAPTTTYAEKSELDAVAATIPSTAADVGALPDTTIIPTTPADIGAAPQAAAPAAADLTADPWARWRAALGRRHTTPAKVLFVGDSTIEGYGVTTWDKRYFRKLGHLLRSLRPTLGLTRNGDGYIAAAFQSGTLTDPATTGSPQYNTDYGFGYRCLRLTSAETVTFNVTGTSIDVWYTGGVTTGTVSVKVDGGAATTWSTTAGANGTVGRRQAISLGASGAHTVVITATNTSPIYLSGIMVYDGDETTGIHIYDAGHGGAKTLDHFINNNRAASFQGHLNLLQPDVVVIGSLINDERQGITPTQYQTDLQQMVSYINTNTTVDPTIVFLEPWREGTSYTYPHDDYVTAARAVAGATPNMVTVDLSTRFPQDDADPSGLIYYGSTASDLVHLTETGQGMFADVLADLLTA